MDPEKQIDKISEMTIDGKNIAAVALGRKGGSATSRKKRLTSAENGAKAGAVHKRKARERRKKIAELERKA